MTAWRRTRNRPPQIPADHPCGEMIASPRQREIAFGLDPDLTIHGREDRVVPLDEGKELYKSSVAVGKRLVIIPNGNHENLHIMGEAVYYAGLKEFIANHA